VVKVKYGQHKKTGRPLARTAGTLNTHLQLLRLVYRVLDAGWPNPFAGVVSALEADVKHYRRLSLDEIRAIHQLAAGDYRTLIEIGYSAGLRLNDAATLKWEAIDLPARSITVRPRKMARRKGAKGLVSPPIVEPLYSTLKAVTVKNRHGYVLKTIGPVYEDRGKRPPINKAIAALFKLAGVKSDAKGQASFHSLRVTWQSLNDDAGTGRPIARSILGHTGPAMSDTYSRIDADAARLAIERAIPAL
jgi:integrase